ncbi:MAG: Rrf2 family transcriptional regulator [Alphaproteobacteria bacterium]|jgi:Rrf2 family nitric oxide-sensitive transcriptional repressor
MRFTRYTDYALRVLMYLGLRPESELSTIKDIATRFGISENHLMKVVHRLGREGFIVTVRGRQGGMRLARSPAEIKIGDVVRRCEDDMRMVECFDEATNTCPIAAACALPPILDTALAAFLAVLDGHTLADLLAPRRELARILQPPEVA